MIKIGLIGCGFMGTMHSECYKKIPGVEIAAVADVRKEFAEKNADALAALLKEYKASIEKTNSDVEATAANCEKYKIIAPAAVAKKAIPNCNIVYQDGKEMKTNLSAYLKFLFDLNPKSVGGKLPADDFYYGVK